jgi:DNA-directed RNA polymerase subunit RPC12/RpoP
MDIVIIRTFQNYFSAHIALTKLRDVGINCFLKDEFTVTVDPILSNAVGGIKLVVVKEQSTEAMELLKEFDEAYRKTVACPRCGSEFIELVPRQTTANLATAILTWIFGSYAISVKNVYQCYSCKYESETLPEAFNSSVDLEEPNLN